MDGSVHLKITRPVLIEGAVIREVRPGEGQPRRPEAGKTYSAVDTPW
jgi:hypothetical protein